ncbi:MAG: DNA topoisomerase IV subunit A [Scrofimicrobium sp.]
MPGSDQTQTPKTHEQIDDIDVSVEMRGSFLEYAYSVIYARALPDARDGLKPVQRRIIYQMQVMGLTPDKGHVKSQRVVGEVMGKLHPHGDSAIYDTLVRLSQDFNLRLPLIDGHGNFGSLDDGPAAPRYTEARLAKPAHLLTDGLDEDAVDFVPNYDNQFKQPDVLPAAFPSLLVNGASGIAVGMATSIAPHNPAETIRGALHLLEHPEATVDDLMRFIPGPDFPAGGIVPGLSGVREAYETGRGSFKIRAKANIERISARRNGIVITELPYMVGPERVIERIKEGVNSGKIKGVSAAQNLTDRHHGLRLVIDVKSGFDPAQVLALLYKHTPLEESFSINAVALVEGQPRTLPLRDMLQVFLDHRLDVTRRRASFQLQKKKDRLHLVDGLLVAVLEIDDVIQIIRSSENGEEARTRLMMAFDLTEIQAQHILDLRLRRLTKFSTLELETERRDLDRGIERLSKLLSSEVLLREAVASDLASVAEEVASPRRTVLLDSEGADPITSADPTSLEIADEPCVVVLTPDGRLSRIGGHEPPATPGTNSDIWLSWTPTTARGKVNVVTADGMAHGLRVETLPGIARSDLAQTLAGSIPFAEISGVRETAIGLYADEVDTILAIGTREGVVKRVKPGPHPPRDSWPVIALEEGDRVVGIGNSDETDFAVFVTRSAQLLKFPLSNVRPQGLPAGGMAGIKLGSGDEVLFFGAITETPDATVATVSGTSDAIPGTVPGRVKLTPLTEYPVKGRATQGVRSHRFLAGEDQLSIAWVGDHSPAAQTAGSVRIGLPGSVGKRDGSGDPVTAVVASFG